LQAPHQIRANALAIPYWLNRGSKGTVKSVMSLYTCFDALRFLALSPELEATRLATAELRINELLEQVKLKPSAQRALLAALNREVKQETEIGPQGAASFWQAISEYIVSRQATLSDD
jgi:hypothetical protein